MPAIRHWCRTGDVALLANQIVDLDHLLQAYDGVIAKVSDGSVEPKSLEPFSELWAAHRADEIVAVLDEASTLAHESGKPLRGRGVFKSFLRFLGSLDAQDKRTVLTTIVYTKIGRRIARIAEEGGVRTVNESGNAEVVQQKVQIAGRGKLRAPRAQH